MKLRRASRPVSLWMCALMGALLGVWLVILTVLFGLLLPRDIRRLNTLEDEYTELEDLVAPVVECCEEIDPTNCTCFAPGTTVECWDASSNTPTIMSGVPPSGDDLAILYIVCTPGNTTVDGVSDWDSGDYIRWVPDAGAWFQNKASASGVTVETIDFNWTCTSWDTWGSSTVPATMTIWTLEDQYFMLYVDGVGPPPCPEGTNVTALPRCTLFSDPPLPAQYQRDDSNPHYERRFLTDEQASSLSNERPPIVAQITDRITVFSDIFIIRPDPFFQNFARTWPACVEQPGEGSNDFLFAYFELVYSTRV